MKEPVATLAYGGALKYGMKKIWQKLRLVAGPVENFSDYELKKIIKY